MDKEAERAEVRRRSAEALALLQARCPRANHKRDQVRKLWHLGVTDKKLWDLEANIWGGIKYLAIDMQTGTIDRKEALEQAEAMLDELGQVSLELETRERLRQSL